MTSEDNRCDFTAAKIRHIDDEVVDAAFALRAVYEKADEVRGEISEIADKITAIVRTFETAIGVMEHLQKSTSGDDSERISAAISQYSATLLDIAAIAADLSADIQQHATAIADIGGGPN